METKDFLGGILDRDSAPQVLNFKGGALVHAVTVDANQVASYIGGLDKYSRLLLKLRISRHARDADYLLSHSNGIGKEDIQKRILLSEFWKALQAIANPHFKK